MRYALAVVLSGLLVLAALLSKSVLGPQGFQVSNLVSAVVAGVLLGAAVWVWYAITKKRPA